MRSDSAALSTVSDQLNLGGSSLDVASKALAQISTTLSDIKQQLLSATSPGVDRNKIQEQITQDEANLKNVANSASFNGQNFLSIDSNATTNPNFNGTKSFVSSFSRDASGNISVGTIAVDVQSNALFDTSTAGYNPAASGAISTSLTAATASAAPPAGVTGTSAFTATVANGQLQITSYTQDPNATSNYYANTISVANTSGASTPVVTESVGTSSATLSSGDTLGQVATSTAPSYNATTKTLTFQVAENSASSAGQYEYHTFTVSNFTPSSGSGLLDKVDTTTTGTYTNAAGTVTSSATTATSTNFAGGATHANGTGVSIENIDISKATDSAGDQAYLNALQKQVDAAIANVAAASSAYGTARARITTQTSFVSDLQTSIKDGIGSLVDADLNVASTRLQALQVQQQLGVQSLSIANQSTQAVLKLFQ